MPIDDKWVTKISEDITAHMMKEYENQLMKAFSGMVIGPKEFVSIVVLIMNLTTNISTYIFYSLRSFMKPGLTVDLPFISTSILNTLKKSFLKFNDGAYNTFINDKWTEVELSSDLIEEIKEAGVVEITLADGSHAIIKKEDIQGIIDAHDKFKQTLN